MSGRFDGTWVDEGGFHATISSTESSADGTVQVQYTGVNRGPFPGREDMLQGVPTPSITVNFTDVNQVIEGRLQGQKIVWGNGTFWTMSLIPLPAETKVSQFGDSLSPELMAQLTPRSLALTKQDLLLLDAYGATGNASLLTSNTKGLTVEDVYSLRSVFRQNSARLVQTSSNLTIVCCVLCCCELCCCCCAISARPGVLGENQAH